MGNEESLAGTNIIHETWQSAVLSSPNMIFTNVPGSNTTEDEDSHCDRRGGTLRSDVETFSTTNRFCTEVFLSWQQGTFCPKYHEEYEKRWEEYTSQLNR